MSNELVIGCLERIRERITENIRTSGEWASGETAKSMRIEETDTGGILYGRPGFDNLEEGSAGAPRKYPYNFKDIIAKWMDAKGIAPSGDRERYKMAASIAWFIRKNGTLLYRAGGRDDIYSNVIEEEVAALKRKLVESTIQTINNLLKN